MKIGFVIYDGMTALDFVGAFDPISRLKTMGFLKNISWEICALTEPVTDAAGLVLTPTQTGTPLNRYDLVVVPGGPAAAKRPRPILLVVWNWPNIALKWLISGSWMRERFLPRGESKRPLI